MLRCFVLIVARTPKGKTITVRSMVSVRPSKNKPKRYTSITHAMERKHLRVQVLRQAKMEIRLWRNRYGHYREFSKLVPLIDELVAA